MKKYLILFVLASAFSFGQEKDSSNFKKNDFRLDLKLPHINHLSLNPNKEFRNDKFGFNGYGIGFEYSYSEKKFLETSFSFALTFELPFPAPVDKEYNKSLFSYYLSLTDNIVLNHFTFGYGINYSVNYWREWYRDLEATGLPTTESTSYSNNNLGITLNTYYKIGKTLNVGIIYRPSIINLNDGFKPIYEHLISLELNWRIKLFSMKK
jgi:hypothetical protein